MQVIKINQSISVPINNNQTLLEAMEASGYKPEYNCRDGHCGSCRCTLESGSVDYIGFTMAYLSPNEVLPCICKAKNDIELTNVKISK